MEKEEIELLSKSYAPIVERLINSNVRYYRFKETIRWCFGYDEEMSIMASCNRKTNVITINLKAFMNAYLSKDMMTIEYYLLHEIRHVFQHIVMKDFEEGKNIPISHDIVNKWIEEEKNYVKSIDENGKENPNYFFQDLEMDAYAFSYSVMKHKYKNVDILYVPPMYGWEFFDMVNEWLIAFKSEGL